MDSRWSTRETVDGFARAAPNATLVEVVVAELARRRSLDVLDLGCGAGRNAVPLARAGARVFGVDRSLPMLVAGRERARQERLPFDVALASMDALPVGDRRFDVVVAHGIWNLARSAAEFRRAIGEATRAVRPGALVFVFTFSRHTLPVDAAPVAGEPFVFTQFAGEPQCFLTAPELVAEMAAAGFEPDPRLPLRELNLPRAGTLQAPRVPVIYEGLFRAIAAAGG